ncbi:MAG TPA: 2-hydroxyacid dehydrogenase [Intrasporangium sp.]|nr:2-hydroxyacid dehydrogenase [Intrasporangium sp.]
MDSSGQVLQVGPLMPELEAALQERYDARALQAPGDQLAPGAAHQVRVAVTSFRTGVPEELMDRLPGMQAIVNFGVGYDNTDVAAASERGITVANTPDVLTDCVADAAVGLVIDVMRRLSASDRYVRAGRWEEEGMFPLSRRVTGARFGILGLGRIGLATAHRLEAFGGRIAYHNRHRRDDVDYPWLESPVALAAASDVLVVTAAGGAGSRGVVDAGVLDALGPQGFLVNVARGSVVDEPALVAALGAGRIAGAGLDCYQDEPRVPGALLGRDDVVLLPHLASGTLETRAEMAALVLENVESLLAEGKLVTPVEP